MSYKTWAKIAQRETTYNVKKVLLLLLQFKKALHYPTSEYSFGLRKQLLFYYDFENSFVKRQWLPILLQKWLPILILLRKITLWKESHPLNSLEKGRCFVSSGLPLCLQHRHNVGSRTRKKTYDRNTTPTISTKENKVLNFSLTSLLDF
jgi:hypothetical protein